MAFLEIIIELFKNYDKHVKIEKGRINFNTQKFIQEANPNYR